MPVQDHKHLDAVNTRRAVLAQARELLSELKNIVSGALEWADDDSAWKIQMELDSIELVRSELDDIATDPEQEISLTTLSGWLRLARDLYSPKVLEEEPTEELAPEEIRESGVIDLKHSLIITVASNKNQAKLENRADVFQLLPQWTPKKKARARSLLVDHIAYADDLELNRMLVHIGRPMP